MQLPVPGYGTLVSRERVKSEGEKDRNDVMIILCRKPADADVEKAAAADAGRSQPVKFQIADDDEDDKPEGAHLLAKPPPYIMIESPSSAKIAGDSSSPTSV